MKNRTNMERVTLGGDRLGSGNKQKISLHGFERSNHDLSYIWRSSMAAGTLVPFMNLVGLPGDTIDINLHSQCLTHPTVGPLFGSYKLQYDVFQIPIRLYNSWLHNNKLDIGRHMSSVLLPLMSFTVEPFRFNENQINSSCILAYLGLRGFGNNQTHYNTDRIFNGVPLLAYWEIYKQYYSNKQLGIGYFVHTDSRENPLNTTTATYLDYSGYDEPLPYKTGAGGNYPLIDGGNMKFYGISLIPEINDAKEIQIYFFRYNTLGEKIYEKKSVWELCSGNITIDPSTKMLQGNYDAIKWSAIWPMYWLWAVDFNDCIPRLEQFELNNIDTMRQLLLSNAGNLDFEIIGQGLTPYTRLNESDTNGIFSRRYAQEGLGIKCYQSDIFNNWLDESWVSDIASQSAVSTLGGSFTIDELTIKKKVWEMLNRIAVSGGTYNDWITATYDQKPFNRAETPVYVGGMSKELIFQEVVSNAASSISGTNQPLGTLAGRGQVSQHAQHHKGGKIVVKCDEHCYIMGIVSITPRLDYSQGNEWDCHLTTMDDFHKPNLDQIGFQDLITEQMASWDTYWNGSQWIQRAAGKQPAWINYQTNYNKCYGSFAEPENEMFMTLNRRYEYDPNAASIKDLTTYIDPSKFNYVFASTKLNAMNFWMQIGVDIEARRKMSAKIMPNL
jgi:hypothetical protein